VSLATKYRPLHYADVLGQEATIAVCRQYVKEGKGFQQSYVFAGAHGGGKTTIARILGRALLCENPRDGEPCDECSQCAAMLADKSENLIEVDAATNSGKEDMKRITEEAQFGSFSGRRKIYILDEAHELSRQAMDALLKPLEDNRRGTSEKQIVCLFCTTEPEKMRPAILSRCAPLFRIRANTPQEIAARLRHICEKEGIDHDPEVLPLIAEVTECHVRDAIQAVEGVSMLGRIDRDNVARYLHLDANALYLDVLENLGSDLPALLATIEKLDEKVSPAVRYERMADVCMLAYRLVNLGEASIPSYWDRQRLEAVGKLHREFLIEFAQRFAQRPVRSTSAMFACDVSALHQRRAGIVVRTERSEVVVPSHASVRASPTPTDPPAPTEATAAPIEPSPKPGSPTSPGTENLSASVGSMSADPYLTETGIGINPLAQNTRRAHEARRPNPEETMPAMPADEFVKTLKRRVIELLEEQSSSGRPARRNDLGSP